MLLGILFYFISLNFRISINNIVAPQPLMSPSPFQLSSSRSFYHPYFYSHQVIALVITSFHFVVILCRGFKSFVTLSLWTLVCTCIIVKVCNVLRCLLLVSCDLEIGNWNYVWTFENQNWSWTLSQWVVPWHFDGE